MYIVFEIQTNNGVVATLTFQYATLNEAKSKYHSILAAAAISSVNIHTAVVMNPYGGIIASEHYLHPTEGDSGEPDDR